MKKKVVGVVCAAALLLTGCGAAFPEMTDEQESSVGEYAAITLLRYDANCRSRLVDLSQIEDEEEQVETPASEPEQSQQEEEQQQNTSETPVVDVSEGTGETSDSMENYLELPEGLSLTYTGYELCQSYQEPSNAYFTLEASEGKQLLVLSFEMRNDSGSEQSVNLLERRDSYRITVDGSYTRSALTTMLDNDLSTYVGVVAPGVSEQMVLMIEVGADQAENIDSISLNMKNESNTYTIQLL
jgi:hypothetical protein